MSPAFPPAPSGPANNNPIGPAPRHRTGLIAPRIGARFRVRQADGEYRVVAVRERARYPEAEKDATFRCLHPRCDGREWVTGDDVVRDHPSAEQMAKDGEAHVCGLYSDAPLKPEAAAPLQGGSSKQDAAFRAQMAEMGQHIGDNRKPDAEIIGFLSDER